MNIVTLLIISAFLLALPRPECMAQHPGILPESDPGASIQPTGGWVGSIMPDLVLQAPASNSRKAGYSDWAPPALTLKSQVDSSRGRVKGFVLEQNYPNPFNPTTVIRFSVPRDGVVTIRLYNLLGRELQLLLNEYKNVGSHSLRFDGSNLPNGNYLYALEAGGKHIVRMMSLVK
ncbi:MAG: T9SS type A sorting domain-containing protein [Proteobacteria bacterium]|nr:T9SS type A sorting domain-containing protein [Pseudomonadota bacterium]